MLHNKPWCLLLLLHVTWAHFLGWTVSVCVLRIRTTRFPAGGGGWRRRGWGGAEWRRGDRVSVQLWKGLPADTEGHHPESAAEGRAGGAWRRRVGHPLLGNNTHHRFRVKNIAMDVISSSPSSSGQEFCWGSAERWQDPMGGDGSDLQLPQRLGDTL